MKYLIVDLYIQRANIKQCSWLASPVIQFPIAMWIHALGRKINQPLNDFFYIHHNYNVFGVEQPYNCSIGKQNGFNYISVKSNQPVAARTQPNIIADMSITVGICLKSDVIVKDVETFVSQSNVAGGSVLQYKTSIAEAHVVSDLPKNVRRGFFLKDRKDLLKDIDNKLDTMLDYLNLVKSDNSKLSWMTASKVGYYKLMETNKNTSRSGNRYPHVLVDPIIGLTQMCSIHTEEHIPLWHYSYNNDNYIVSTI